MARDEMGKIKEEMEKVREEVGRAVEGMEEVVEVARKILKKFGEEILKVLESNDTCAKVVVEMRLDDDRELKVTLTQSTFSMSIVEYGTYEEPKIYTILTVCRVSDERFNYVSVHLDRWKFAELLIENFEDILSAMIEKLKEYNRRCNYLVEKANKILKALNSHN